VSGLDSGVFGAELSAISIIVVYHLFSIQTWLQAAITIETEIEALRGNSLPGDLSRAEGRARALSHLNRFPWLTVTVLGIALGLLGILAIVAGASLDRVKPIFTAGPVVILLSTVAAATWASFIQGRKALKAAVADFSEL
jgi:hypothetical protein